MSDVKGTKNLENGEQGGGWRDDRRALLPKANIGKEKVTEQES